MESDLHFQSTKWDLDFEWKFDPKVYKIKRHWPRKMKKQLKKTGNFPPSFFSIQYYEQRD